MPLEILHCQTTGDLVKLVRRGAVFDARLGGVDASKLGMKQYLITIAPVPISGNAARYKELRTQLLAGV